MNESSIHLLKCTLETITPCSEINRRVSKITCTVSRVDGTDFQNTGGNLKKISTLIRELIRKDVPTDPLPSYSAKNRSD